jgi:hypothetical protein
VVFFDALHHAENEKAALTSVHSVLRRGGVCVASEPGRGHSNTPESIKAVELYGVNEKDMPPSHVAAVTKDLSFQIEIYPHVSQIARLLAPGKIEFPGSRWKQWLVNQPLFRPILVYLLIIHLKRHNGIVVLTKQN